MYQDQPGEGYHQYVTEQMHVANTLGSKQTHHVPREAIYAPDVYVLETEPTEVWRALMSDGSFHLGMSDGTVHRETREFNRATERTDVLVEKTDLTWRHDDTT